MQDYFLTGYADFDYVYKVHKHARYVLKAEEDEKLLEALRESIEEIEQDLLLEQATSLQQERQDSSIEARSFFLRELFEGNVGLSQLDEALSGELDVGLDPSKRFTMCCCGMGRGTVKATRSSGGKSEPAGN